MFDGGDPPERDHWTTAYADQVAAGDGRYLLIADNQGKERRLFDTEADPDEENDVAEDNPEVVSRLWQNVLDDAGGTMPVFGKTSCRERLKPRPIAQVPCSIQRMPATSCSAPIPSPRASRAMVPRRGSRTALSRREISVGCMPVFSASCSWESIAAARCRRRFAANCYLRITPGILGEVADEPQAIARRERLRDALQRVELAGAYQRAARARREGTPAGRAGQRLSISHCSAA